MIPAMMLTTAETPKATGQGFVIKVTEEMAQVMGLPLGGFVLMSGEGGVIRTEVLPPLSPELAQIAKEVFQDNLEVFQELKRLGD